MIVVDASIAVKWVVEEVDRDRAREIVASNRPIIGPAIVIPEVANVLRKKVKRGELQWTQVALAIEAIGETYSQLVDV